MRTLAKLTWVELKLFVREPYALIFTFVFPVVVLAVLAGVFGSEPDDDAFGGLVPSDYYLAGYVAVVIAAIGLVALPVHVATYRERGILRRFRASSVPVSGVLGAQVVVGLIMATAGSILLVIVGRLMYDAAAPESIGRVAIAFTMSTLAFLAIGFLVAGLTKNARGAQSLGMILFFPMWLLSGAGPPPDVLTEDPWLGAGSGTADLIRLAVVFVAAGALSVMMLRSA
jgi:ABC-2 type transport system permease protein